MIELPDLPDWMDDKEKTIKEYEDGYFIVVQFSEIFSIHLQIGKELDEEGPIHFVYIYKKGGTQPVYTGACSDKNNLFESIKINLKSLFKEDLLKSISSAETTVNKAKEALKKSKEKGKILDELVSEAQKLGLY